MFDNQKSERLIIQSHTDLVFLITSICMISLSCIFELTVYLLLEFEPMMHA